MQRAGLDPTQIPELGHSSANSTEDESSAAVHGKQLLAATFQGAQPTPQATPPRPRRWVIKTEAELPPIDLKSATPFPLTLPPACAGWDELIRSIKRSDLGATGVFFLLLGDDDRLDTAGGVLVLKRVSDLNSALYEGAR